MPRKLGFYVGRASSEKRYLAPLSQAAGWGIGAAPRHDVHVVAPLTHNCHSTGQQIPPAKNAVRNDKTLRFYLKICSTTVTMRLCKTSPQNPHPERPPARGRLTRLGSDKLEYIRAYARFFAA